MDIILTGNIWKRVASQTKAAKRRLVAVAYVSSDEHLKLKGHDVLICDASNRVIKAGETSAKVLRSLFDNDVELRCYRDLHAKVADEDATISWIRWTGKSRFRSTAREGDMVIQICKSLSGKRVTVFSPCPIVLCQNVAHWTRFYVSESEDGASLPWGRFEKEAKKLGLNRISKGSVRELNARETLLIESQWK